MNFCTECGGSLVPGIPPGDDRSRLICERCHAVHYRNPKIVTGCLPLWEGRILLCKRAIEPRLGYWTLPCGYMEEGESVEEGAIRETYEESLANVEISRLYAVVSLPEISQVYLVFLAALKEEVFAPTPESEQVKLVKTEEIPWEELAFPAIEFVLRAYTREGAGTDNLHVGRCAWPPGSRPSEDPGVSVLPGQG